MSEDTTDPILAAETGEQMDAAIRGRSLEDVVRAANASPSEATALLLLAAIERRLANRKARRETRLAKTGGEDEQDA